MQSYTEPSGKVQPSLITDATSVEPFPLTSQSLISELIRFGFITGSPSAKVQGVAISPSSS